MKEEGGGRHQLGERRVEVEDLKMGDMGEV